MSSPQHNKRREMDVMKLCALMSAPVPRHSPTLGCRAFLTRSRCCRLMSDWKVELPTDTTKNFEVLFHGPPGSAFICCSTSVQLSWPCMAFLHVVQPLPTAVKSLQHPVISGSQMHTFRPASFAACIRSPALLRRVLRLLCCSFRLSLGCNVCCACLSGCSQ